MTLRTLISVDATSPVASVILEPFPVGGSAGKLSGKDQDQTQGKLSGKDQDQTLDIFYWTWSVR